MARGKKQLDKSDQFVLTIIEDFLEAGELDELDTRAELVEYMVKVAKARARLRKLESRSERTGFG